MIIFNIIENELSTVGQFSDIILEDRFFLPNGHEKKVLIFDRVLILCERTTAACKYTASKLMS